jgi:hypothetical protein
MKKKIFLIIFLASFILKAQNQNDICKNMGKIKVTFTNTLTKDSLLTIQKELLKKGVELKFKKMLFDNKTGGLRYLSFEVKCIGCNTGGTAVLGRDSFKKGEIPWGIYFNHGHSPYFKIGDISGL